MKKIMWGISGISLIGTLAVLRFMPDRVPMHYDLAGNIDRWGSKYENLIFPIVILALSLFWTLMIGFFEKKGQKSSSEKEHAEAKSNANVLSAAGVSTVSMFTVMQGFILYSAYKEAVSSNAGQAVDMGMVTAILIGVLFIVLGNFMTKTRVNSAVGVRTAWSMYNDNTWRKSNRFGAFALIISGILTIITAVLLKSSFGAILAALGFVILASIVTVLYSHSVYLREIKDGKGDK